MTRCPECGAVLERIAGTVSELVIAGFQVLGRPLARRGRLAVFVACPACEFCQEVR